MTHSIEEQLSAFLDGELPEAELELLLRRLDREPARRHLLARYALIGECLRSGRADPGALSLAERVRSRLADQATSAPVPPAVATQGPVPSRRGWMMGGMAAAAALAALLVGGPDIWRDDPVPEAPAPYVAGLPGIGVEPVRFTASHRVDPRAAARLTGYLVMHGEYANQLSRASLDSHLVSARAERAAWRQPVSAPDGR
ncbi:MAG: hypothetical protein IT486_06630 [Gammaproteobacteria bacterium]|nr:hypothetical protein [Gammaproteobacteria bacterium]